MIRIGGANRVTLADFNAALTEGVTPDAAVRDQLKLQAQLVADVAQSATPAYGVNTGLGSNLGHRIAPADISDFQLQLIRGRAAATGDPLPSETGRAVLLARIITAAQGGTGMSLQLFDHLCAAFASGLSPAIPGYGSLGASDLTQTACWALGVLGEDNANVFVDGQSLPAADALALAGVSPTTLAAKDGLLLASQTGLTIALAARALTQATTSLQLARHAAALSFAGFAANDQILEPRIAELKPHGGQPETAAWLRDMLQGSSYAPARIQDALSFRTVVAVIAAAEAAVANAIQAWEDDLNTPSDSPLIVGGVLCSTAHFQSPALALALEGVALSFAMLAHASCQRLQKLMMPELSGLPRFLAPAGGASAGMVPIQKTAAALLAEVRKHAQPVVLDPVSVSETVEDMAPMTPQAAQKLISQTDPLDLLFATEAMVAAQAIDLRGKDLCGTKVRSLHTHLRCYCAELGADRSLGPDIQNTKRGLCDWIEGTGVDC